MVQSPGAGKGIYGKDTCVSALQHYRTPDGLAPGPGYSHAVTGRGRWVATAGQVALDETGTLVGPGDPEAQARQVFANLARALAAAGASFADVVKLNYYLTYITVLPAIRAIRDEYVDTARPPASTAVQVSALGGFCGNVDLALVPVARSQRYPLYVRLHGKARIMLHGESTSGEGSYDSFDQCSARSSRPGDVRPLDLLVLKFRL